MGNDMADYGTALRQQNAEAKRQERIDESIPERDAVPLIVSNPYANPHIILDAHPWVAECTECCDYSTFCWMTDDKISFMTGNLSSLGITSLDPDYTRHRLDLDRKPNSYNPAFNDRWQSMTFSPDDDDIYAANGVGVVWMRVPGDTEMPLYLGDNQPTQKQIESLMDNYHEYHGILSELISSHMDRFGGTLHISLQPFSREEAYMMGFDESNIPQFSLCDGNGTTCDPNFLEKLRHTIAGKGYRISTNELFPTGELTARHAHPANRVHAVQLKIFEELYLDPNTLERGIGFRKISRDLHGIFMAMADYAKTHIRKSEPEETNVIEQHRLDSRREQEANSGPKPPGE